MRFAEDAELKAFLQPYQEQGQVQLQVKIGEVDAKLEGDRDVIRFQPTNLGVLIAQAQMDKTQSDLAVMNSGGVRDSIAAGDITYKDVLKVQPFANAVAFVELSGELSCWSIWLLSLRSRWTVVHLHSLPEFSWKWLPVNWTKFWWPDSLSIRPAHTGWRLTVILHRAVTAIRNWMIIRAM